jgi:hypothetical protein
MKEEPTEPDKNIILKFIKKKIDKDRNSILMGDFFISSGIIGITALFLGQMVAAPDFQSLFYNLLLSNSQE